MKSLNLKPNEDVYILTDYVLEQIYSEKPPGWYSSKEAGNKELSKSSDEFTFSSEPTKEVKSTRVKS